MRQLVRARLIVIGVIIFACPLLASSPAFALNPTLDLSQYAHASWKVRDGFAKGEITEIAQTPDGYLWLGTEFGLLRFDGIRAVPWQPPSDQQLPNDRIASLLAARDGTLWIGTVKGLASWKEGKLTLWPDFDGRIVISLLEDHEGTIWAGAVGFNPRGGVCRIQNGKSDCSGEDAGLGQGVTGLYEDSNGNIWAGLANGIVRWKPGPPAFFSVPGNVGGIYGFAEDNNGRLLIGTKQGIRQLVDGRIEANPIAGNEQDFNIPKLLRDRDGALWIGNRQGIYHLHQGRIDSFTQADGLAGNFVNALFEDREGNIWIASVSGIDRFRDFTVATYSTKQGFSDSPSAVTAARDGSVWFSSGHGLLRWLKGKVSIFGEAGADTSAGSAKPEGAQNRLNPNSLFADAGGRIWVSSANGVGYLDNDRFVSIDKIPGGPVHSMTGDAIRNLWIANQNNGLYRLSPDLKVQHIAWTDLGVKDYAYAVGGDPLQTGIWLGFYQGGIAYLEDGQIRAKYTTADGLGGGTVHNFRFEPDGAMWITTQGGLSRLKNGRIDTITSKNGLPCDGVQWLVEGDDHSFWLPSPCGLLRITRTELDAWADAIDKNRNSSPMVKSTVFDNVDGMRSASFGSGYSPTAAKSTDGKLWFIGVDGVSVVDPNYLPFNKLPPPVHIEQITADRKSYDVPSGNSDSLHLPALSRDLQIDYTALSLVAPDKNRFRYKLEGYDSDWQDAGNRRTAFYTNLPPRNYRFRVVASNNSGVWNETGAFLDFTIAPAYYQTNWFRLLLLAAFLLILGAIYQWRVRQVALQVRGRMEERLEERERIARDLHDTLLQSVQGLILKFHAVASKIQKNDPANSALEDALDSADQVLAEGRDRIRNLRVDADSLSDLPAAFQEVARTTMQNGDMTLKTIVEGRVRELHPLVLHESFAIGREALVNALTHSEGRHVEVEVIYEPRQFRLRVRDDGCGIDPTILQQGGRIDHWGLRGMHERAHKIGGKLEIWSRAETGTELELTVPAGTAYATKGSKPRFPRFRSPAAGKTRDQ